MGKPGLSAIWEWIRLVPGPSWITSLRFFLGMIKIGPGSLLGDVPEGMGRRGYVYQSTPDLRPGIPGTDS